MTDKTEIKIDGDTIIYNGVKYQKVQEESKKNTPNLTNIIEDILKEELLGCKDIKVAPHFVDEIVQRILGEMSFYIPDYGDWEDALNEIADKNLPQDQKLMFRQGWNAYCKEMWDMINDD